MTTTTHDTALAFDRANAMRRAEAADRIRRRLRPLYLASGVLGINLWVPVEKLFLSQIGFTAATVGLLAATYSTAVPFLEIPSGILADRWSRRGVLIIANLALAGSALVGGLSTNVPTYLAAALLLGVYFALHSGTIDSIIYDVLAEETGHSDGYEKYLGRVQLWQGAAMVASALAGGAVAALTSPRTAYFLTIPFALASIGALARFREPRLHKANETLPLRSQITTTYRTITRRSRLRLIILTMVLTALLLQMLLEFGPLWMIALAAPAILYGPQWAGLMSAMGLGGALAGRISLTRPAALATAIAAVLASSLTLATSHNPAAVIAAQVVLALLLVAASTLLTRLLHDEIPSSLRAGVSSGVGTLTWMAFLPFALAFGFLGRHAGVYTAAWMIVAASIAACAALLRLARRRHPHAITSHRAPPQPSNPPASLAQAGC